jgi:hypothetical protein
MFVQANIILSIMKGDNGYFATNQRKVNIIIIIPLFKCQKNDSSIKPLSKDTIYINK